jgi:two-component system alkaline phosphatase synthesis response regulator PhoP
LPQEKIKEKTKTMKNKLKKRSRILLVEDEESLADGLSYNLSEEGYYVHWVQDGKQAVQAAQERSFDLIILDIMLPYLDGFQVAQAIRANSPQIPILMLTARTRIEDKIKGLEIGADDYLTKPFNLEELLLRLQGMLRRQRWYQKAAGSQPVYRFGENEINFKNLSCRTNRKSFYLTHREAMVLKYLIGHKEEIVSRKTLLENVWGISPEVETRTVDNFISRLRKYFETDPANPVYIKSVRSVGYIFHE